MPHRRLLASCLAAALAFPAVAGALPSLAPPLAQMPVQTQVMAPVVARFRADLASLERVHDTTAGTRREAARCEFFFRSVCQKAGLVSQSPE